MDAATAQRVLAHVVAVWKKCPHCGGKDWTAGDAASPVVGGSGVNYQAALTCTTCGVVATLDLAFANPIT